VTFRGLVMGKAALHSPFLWCLHTPSSLLQRIEASDCAHSPAIMPLDQIHEG